MYVPNNSNTFCSLSVVVTAAKYSVVRIVREKMLRTEAFTDPEQLQAFLSQLYVFLVDEMHVALNKVGYAQTKQQPVCFHLSLSG